MLPPRPQVSPQTVSQGGVTFPCSRVTSSESKKREWPPPQHWGQASLLPAPSVTPTSLGHRVRNCPPPPLFPLKFPVSLYGTQGQTKFLSKWWESCSVKVKSEGFIAPFQFPCCLCSSGPVADARALPCILMKGDEMG